MGQSDRIDKIIADSGLGSRKQVRKLIRSARVLVDGEKVNDPGMHIIRGQHTITVDGHPVRQQPLTIMLNKPVGVITATHDAQHKTVLDLLPPGTSRRLVPAGRLDKDTEGLLILTEDGALCHHLISPKRGVEKQYIAQVIGETPPDLQKRFREGIRLADGTLTLPAGVEIVRPKTYPFDEGSDLGKTFVKVTLTEGKYHQVRRMLAACGLHVEKLRRIRIGGLCIDQSLGPGDYRPLSTDEAELLVSRPEDDGTHLKRS